MPLIANRENRSQHNAKLAADLYKLRDEMSVEKKKQQRISRNMEAALAALHNQSLEDFVNEEPDVQHKHKLRRHAKDISK